MKINPNTIEFMLLITWWFINLWVFRILAVVGIGKGIGGAINGKMGALGGKRSQEQSEGEREKSRSPDKANAVSADESVSNHC